MNLHHEKNNTILIIAGGSANNLSVISNINKILKILKALELKPIIITPCGKDHNINLNIDDIFSVANTHSNFINFFLSQLIIAKRILKLHKKFRICIFIFGEDLLIIPIIILKFFGKKVIIRSDGRPSKILKKYFKNCSKLKLYLFFFIEKINYKLADMILTECEYMIYDNQLEEYNSAYVGNLFIDTDLFKKNRNYFDRTYDIGYIGRFHQEKGLLNLLEAIPFLIKKYQNIKIILVGDGELRDYVETAVQILNTNNNIIVKNWVSTHQLPNILNDIKLILLPSYKEGLPNILLESIACETPVLATPVGGILGIIKDGETGFIMENNKPSTIVENVIRVFETPNLKDIMYNGKQLVISEYQIERVLENWKVIIKIFNDKEQ